MSYLELTDEQLLAQCEIDCYRASGPGGQKRNKTSSAVRLRHLPSGVAAIANEDRSQHVNKARALRRLRMAIALHIRSPKKPGSIHPSELLSSCLSAARGLSVGRRDRRYAQAVGEILDLFSACSAAVRETAAAIGISSANLVKFLKTDPALWREVNSIREKMGRTRLN